MVRLRYSAQTPPPPRAWTARLKQRFGILLRRIGLSQALELTPWERRSDAPVWQTNLEAFFRSSVAIGVLLLVMCLAITLAWGWAAGAAINDLWSEMGGTTLDVVVVLIIYELFAQRRQRRDAIDRQLEVIDDYKRWDAEEARLRIAGALRRLQGLQVSKINFAGLHLSDFCFAAHGVRTLSGSTFYDGDWGNPHNVSQISLDRVDFSHVDCSGVQFSPFDPFEALTALGSGMKRYATLTDCRFESCNLESASFNGAALSWTQPPVDDHHEYTDDETGRASVRVSVGPFYRSSLKGASFRGCRLQNADFRDAENLDQADFFRAEGLASARFDTDEIRAVALASAERPE